ncbi:MAG: hypothetical protein QOE98_3056 [Gaiellaceae bacterium]|nr:hypothetical protein [Gaiellaceae bacterium]
MSTLGRYRRQALANRLSGWGGRAAVIAPALVLGIGAAFATRTVGGTLAGVVLGAIAGFAVLWQLASSRAIRLALEAWGTDRGLAVADPAPLPERMRWIDSTDGEMGPGLTGPIAGGEGGVGHYTYTTGSGKDRTDHPYTLAWTEIAVRDRAAVSLGRREFGSGLFTGLIGALSAWREVELESVDFEKRFALWVSDETDDLVVRRFFTPAMIARCLDHPPAGRLEIGAGVLCLSLERHLLEPDDLTDAAAELERWADALRRR